MLLHDGGLLLSKFPNPMVSWGWGPPSSFNAQQDIPLESIDSVADQVIRNGDKQDAIAIVDFLAEISASVLAVDDPMASINGSHSMSDLAAGYQKNIAVRAIPFGMEDVPMVAARRMTARARRLFAAGLRMSGISQVKRLKELGEAATVGRMRIACSYANEGIMQILGESCGAMSEDDVVRGVLIRKAAEVNLSLLGGTGLYYLGEAVVSPALSATSETSFASCFRIVLGRARSTLRNQPREQRRVEGAWRVSRFSQRLEPRIRELVPWGRAMREIILSLRDCGELAATIDDGVAIQVTLSLEAITGVILSVNDVLRMPSLEDEAAWSIGSIATIATRVEPSRPAANFLIRESLNRLGNSAARSRQWAAVAAVVNAHVAGFEKLKETDGGQGSSIRERLVSGALLACVLWDNGRTKALKKIVRVLKYLNDECQDSGAVLADVEGSLFGVEQTVRQIRQGAGWMEDRTGLAEVLPPQVVKMLRRTLFRTGVWPYTIRSNVRTAY